MRHKCMYAFFLVFFITSLCTIETFLRRQAIITMLSRFCSFSSSNPCSCCLLSTCSPWHLPAKQNKHTECCISNYSVLLGSKWNYLFKVHPVNLFTRKKSALGNSIQRYYPWNWDSGKGWHHRLLPLARVMTTKVVFEAPISFDTGSS